MSAPVPSPVAEQARNALAERDRRQGGGNLVAVTAALQLAAAPFVGDDTLAALAAWHRANPAATLPDGRCTLLAGLYGGRPGRDWAMAAAATPADSWLPEESVALCALTAAAPEAMSGGMICLYPDDPETWAVPGGDPADLLHLTLAFVAEDAGALSPDSRIAIHEAAMAGAAVRPGPLALSVVGYGTLGAHDPVATVLFLQADDDHAREGVSVVEQAVRAVLDDFGAEAFPVAHDMFISHATIGYGVPVDEAEKFMGKEMTFSAGVSTQLGTERTDYPWAGSATAAISEPFDIIRDPEPKRRRKAKPESSLDALSRRLVRSERRLRTEVIAGAQVAMSEALRRAGAKIVGRARTKAAKAAVDACEGCWNASVLAAVGIDELDAFHGAFDTYGERFEAWAMTASEEQVRAIAEANGVDPDELWAKVKDEAERDAGAAKALAVAALLGWAIASLLGPPPIDPEGEQPLDPTLPPSLLGPALAKAAGRPVQGPGSDGVGPMRAGEVVALPGPGRSARLLGQLLTGDVVEVVTWHHGSPATPFEPHLNLDGDKTTYARLATDWANTREWPSGPYFHPLDHRNCSCSLSESFVTRGEAVGLGLVSAPAEAVA